MLSQVPCRLLHVDLEIALDQLLGAAHCVRCVALSEGPSLFTALREQLGLRLESDEVPPMYSPSIAWSNPLPTERHRIPSGPRQQYREP